MKNIPTFKPEDYEALEDFCAWARAKAKSSYKKLDDGHYALIKSPVSQDADKHDTFESAVYEVDKRNTAFKKIAGRLKATFQRFNKQSQNIIEQVHDQLDIQSYKHLRHSSDSTVLEAHGKDSRDHAFKLQFAFSLNESGQPFGGSRLESFRSSADFMFQAQRCPLDKNIELEVMPIVCVVDAEDLPDSSYAFHKLMDYIYEDTCYEVDKSPAYDVVISPEGGVGYIDPGNLPYKLDHLRLPEAEREKEEARSKEIEKKRVKDCELIEQLNPRDENGKLKQLKFFPQKEIAMNDEYNLSA